MTKVSLKYKKHLKLSFINIEKTDKTLFAGKFNFFKFQKISKFEIFFKVVSKIPRATLGTLASSVINM